MSLVKIQVGAHPKRKEKKSEHTINGTTIVTKANENLLDNQIDNSGPWD